MSKERTEHVEQEAGEWLAHRHTGDWTEDDQCAFDQWLGATLEHRVAYLRLERMWRETDRLKALGAGVPSYTPPPPGQWNLTSFFHEVPLGGASDVVKSAREPDQGTESSTHQRQRRTRRWYAIAASLLVGTLVVTGTWLVWPAANTYSTDTGGLASVPMQDGSKVTLNTDSQIRIDLSDHERRVDLRHGEAYVEVAHDPGRPFVVEAGNKRIIAVGTKFSVRRNDNDVQVVVTEGKVRVEERGKDAVTPKLLTAGSVARATDAGVLVQTTAVSEAEEQLSWRSGVLIFRNQSLADAIAEFNRYNTRKIVIEDPAIAALRIEGNFRATNIGAFARLLEQGYGLSVTEETNRIRLTR